MDDIPRSVNFGSVPIILILILILLGGFFAAAETAYSNCSRVRLQTWADDGRRSARRALSILDQFDKTIITLLIGNNVTHVVAATIATGLGISLVGDAGGSLLSTIVMTILIFIFSETLPKTIAKVNSDSAACLFSGILSVLIFMLTPISILFLGIQSVGKKMRKNKDEGPVMTEDDFTTMIETIEDEGVLEADESELIQSAVEFHDRTVQEILTPRVRMVGLDLSAGEEACFRTVLSEKFTRLPVFRHDMDHIIGVLNTKQYLAKRVTGEAPSIEAIMTQPYFIRPDMKLHALVEEMRSRKTHLAIVQDECGGTEGMVTLEDLLEELVGDIWDEDEGIRLSGKGAEQ